MTILQVASIVARTFSARAADSFSLNPLTDVRWTVLKLDALGFPARQKLDCIWIDQRHVLQIQNQMMIIRFQSKEPLQLRHIFRLNTPTQDKDDFSIR